MFWNGKLFKRSIKFVMLGLELYIGNMGFTKFLYIKVNVGPDISTIDEFQYFVV